jgi:RNA polymerase II subunit A-like phosphatase
MWARSFGARINASLTKSTTHVIAHKERRTSKVRQSTQHPQIQIVSITWLLECFSRWQHVEEGPHIIEFDRDSGHHDSLPFDELDEGVTLTPSEEGDEPGDLPEDLENEPLSPTFERGELQWDDLDDEVKDFLGSDDESDFDDGSGSDTSNASNKSERSSTRKRKRASSSVDGGTGEEEAEGDTTVPSGEPGSNLQKRRKKAAERSTGLAHVTVADQSSGLPSPETTGPDEENEKPSGADDVEDEDVDDEIFAKAFQDAMDSPSDDEVAI